MAESGIKSYFPSQTVSDAEKLSYDYGLKVAKAIETEWFNNDKVNYNKYRNNQNDFHRLRLYARGEQSIRKYKDELSINGDLSYLNLDWTPVPIIPKFVDIVVNGIAERTYDIKAYSQDPHGVAKRTKYMEAIISDMEMQEFNQEVESRFNVNMKETDIVDEDLPKSSEDIRQAHAAAIETYINDYVGIVNDGQYGDLYFNRTLNDWARFDITKRTKFDATISSGLAVMANNRHLYAPNAKVEKPKLNINISKYSNTGTNSQIIK